MLQKVCLDFETYRIQRIFTWFIDLPQNVTETARKECTTFYSTTNRETCSNDWTQVSDTTRNQTLCRKHVYAEIPWTDREFTLMAAKNTSCGYGQWAIGLTSLKIIQSR